MDIFQSQRFKSSLRRLGDTTSSLARIMRTDAKMKKSDYAEISRLNDRLKRAIPIIPAAFGVSGAALGMGVSDGGFPGFFGLAGFPGFAGPPGGPPTSQGPQSPTGPSGPVPPAVIKEEELETQIPQRKPEETPVPESVPGKPIPIPVEPFKPGAPGTRPEEEEPKTDPQEVPEVPIILPPKREDPPEKEPSIEPDKEPIPLPDPPPPPIPLVPPFPIPRRKKEEEEEKELVPMNMSLYEFELALRSRRQKDKGADPGWLGPYYEYLMEYFRREKRGGAVPLPDGGLLTMRVVGGLFSSRKPVFRYRDGISWNKTKKSTQQGADALELVQAVMAVLGPFAAATGARPGQGTPRQPPTVQDPNFRAPKPGPLFPQQQQPGNKIEPFFRQPQKTPQVQAPVSFLQNADVNLKTSMAPRETIQPLISTKAITGLDQYSSKTLIKPIYILTDNIA